MKRTQSGSIRRVLAPAILVLATGASLAAWAAPAMLSDAEIAKLQETAVDAKRNTRLTFEASVQKSEEAAPGEAGKIPFVIFCALNETKESGGETLSRRLSGTAEIRVLDKDKKVVLSDAQPLEKMCSA